MQPVTIIMYHYVRDLENPLYPRLKALRINEFKEQLKFLQKHYVFVSIHDCIRVINSQESNFPPNAVLLTFDDGYLDHYTNVLPLLDSMGIQACFFPSAKAIMEHKVLDVNKIHFLLASTHENVIMKAIYEYLDKYRCKYKLKETSYYYSKLAKKFRLDTKEVIFIKRLLQKELPIEARTIITNKLFARFVTSDESAFAEELYLTPKMIKEMDQRGMTIGAHGYNHCWLATISDVEQKIEIDKSLSFMQSLSLSTDEWAMCYPYGSYNDKLIELLRNKKCKIAFTSDVDIANLSPGTALQLSRLDTMDIPRKADAQISYWTKKAIL